MDINNKKEKTKFAELFYGLAEEYGGTITKNGVNLKMEAMKGFSIEDITKAANWIVLNRKEKFPPIPTVKEFVDAIEGFTPQIGGNAKAQLECDKVIKNLKFFGRECPTVFKDKITQYLMTNRWSFYKLGMMEEVDLKWFRRDFVEAYKEMDSSDVNLIDVAEKAGMLPAHDKLKQLGFKGKKI
jgi:hypothetical protein